MGHPEDITVRPAEYLEVGDWIVPKGSHVPVVITKRREGTSYFYFEVSDNPENNEVRRGLRYLSGTLVQVTYPLVSE